MLKITRADEALPESASIFLIYGQPGVGKTSVASVTDAPLLLDFDRGAKRSAFRPDSVQVTAWADVAGISADDLKGRKTLILDTAGRALDFIAAGMPTSEGKTQLKRSSGDLTLQGYGALKGAFNSWLKRITTFGVDVVMIAHDKEDKDGDTRVMRPDIMGGSFGEVLKVADFVGYMYRDGNKQTILDFNPNDRWLGKNSAGLEPLIIPANFGGDPEWFGGIMKRCKSALGAIAERQKAAVDQLRALNEQLAQAEDVSGLVDAMGFIGDEWGRGMKLQAWNAITKRAKEIGFKYNKAAGVFEPVQEAATA